MRLTATLLAYGEESTPDAWGDVVTFLPDALFSDDHQSVPLLIQHYDREGGAAGRALELWTEGGRVRGTFELLDTPAGRQAALELAAGVRWDVSVGVRLEDYVTEQIDPDDRSFWAPVRATVTSADLVEVSLCLRGRMPTARVDSIDAQPQESPE